MADKLEKSLADIMKEERKERQAKKRAAQKPKKPAPKKQQPKKKQAPKKQQPKKQPKKPDSMYTRFVRVSLSACVCLNNSNLTTPLVSLSLAKRSRSGDRSSNRRQARVAHGDDYGPVRQGRRRGRMDPYTRVRTHIHAHAYSFCRHSGILLSGLYFEAIHHQRTGVVSR
jgi:hypothetical protein